MRSLKLAALLLCSVLLIACDWLPGQTEDEGDPIDFEDVESAERLDVQQAQTVVFRSEAGWETFWYEHVNSYGSEGNKTPPPPIDFESRMLIGVFWGEGYSGCSNYVQAIEGVKERESRIEVEVGELPDLGACRAFVYPLQVIKMKRSDQSVRFIGKVPAE